MRIAEKMCEVGTVKAASLPELKVMLGFEAVSNTQFGKALRSLHYKYGPVRVNRPLVLSGYEPREYHVTYVATRAPARVAAEV